MRTGLAIADSVSSSGSAILLPFGEVDVAVSIEVILAYVAGKGVGHAEQRNSKFRTSDTHV